MDCSLDTQKTPSRIAIGTAQFGLNYGVSNSSGQVSQANIESILNVARSYGIDTLDTAKLYGTSEYALGQAQPHKFRIVTKLPAVPPSTKSPATWISSQVLESLEKLGTNRVDALLLHRPEQLFTPIGKEVSDSLHDLKRQGLVDKIGITIYTPDDLESLLAKLDIDLIQAPFNVLDQRLYISGWLEQLTQRGIEVHTRSAFLQGLLLMPPQNRPTYFDQWNPLFQMWSSWLAEHQLTPLEACLRYVLQFPQISKVVVGVETANQLEEIIKASLGSLPPLPQTMLTEDQSLINPSLWKLT
ncbi:aldo/keto reductase [Pontibacterium sp.]|uniref:aldo/keto reductase n=1 Tax=Pontibacterium sp. TaxID=2036026 RepID=UPI003511227A